MLNFAEILQVLIVNNQGDSLGPQPCESSLSTTGSNREEVRLKMGLGL